MKQAAISHQTSMKFSSSGLLGLKAYRLESCKLVEQRYRITQKLRFAPSCYNYWKASMQQQPSQMETHPQITHSHAQHQRSPDPPDDYSIIHELIPNKDQLQTQDLPVPVPQQPPQHPSKDHLPEDHEEYGELLQVKQLVLQNEQHPRDMPDRIFRIEGGNHIKVFIDPNPPDGPTATRSKPSSNSEKQAHLNNSSNIPVLQTKGKAPFSIGIKSCGSHDLRKIQLISGELQHLKKDLKEEPKTVRRKGKEEDSDAESSDKGSERGKEIEEEQSIKLSQADSFQQFQEYKRRKKSNSVKMLIRKVENLQQKVKELKKENRSLEKQYETRKYGAPPKKTKQCDFISNLISIKVETDGIATRDNILQELKRIKEKVSLLENKSNDFSNTYVKSPLKLTQYLSNSPEHLAESKIETNSHLVYSQARDTAKQTGKIFKKSAVRVAEEISPSLLPVATAKTAEIKAYNSKLGQVSDPVQEKKQKSAELHKQQGQLPVNTGPGDAIAIIKARQIKNESVPGETGKVLPDNLNESSKKEETSQQDKDFKFVRTGIKINNIPPSDNISKEDWEQSLKMLEFDPGNQLLILESNETEEVKKFSKKNMKSVVNFEEANELIPCVPVITRFPTYDTSEEELIEMGTELFKTFEVAKINDDQTVLKVKKYKNCTYFGIDSDNNIILHYEGKVYIGGWKEFNNGEGEKSGDGVEYLEGKFIYKGQFHQGKRNGFGVLKTYNSSKKATIYIGQFSEGNKHGEGKQIDQTGLIYDGQWKYNKRDGFGRLILSQSQYYEGTFERGLKSGNGSQFFKNGDRYQGQYLEGKFHGKGTYYWNNGSTYEGQFKNGMRNGKGIWKSAGKQKDIYEGQYENDLKSGYGVYIWANGSSYQGNFKNDKKHGQGTITHENGKISKLEWQDGNVVKNLDEGESAKQSFSSSSFKNHNRSLPVNRKFLSSRQKERTDKKGDYKEALINNEGFNRLNHSQSAVSTMLPKGISFRQSRPHHIDEEIYSKKVEDVYRKHQMTDRPMTGKSSASGPNFRVQKKHVVRAESKEGALKDPPYKTMRPSTNIINF